MKRFAPVLAPLAPVLLLAACLPAGGPFAGTGTCPAPDLQGLVGRPESVVTGITYAGPRRVIHPGEMVTMDYSPERLNIEIGEDGRIARITCG